MIQYVYEKYLPALAIGALVLVMLPVAKIIHNRRNSNKLKSYPRDKVILFQLPRAPWAPSISPFALKLETYLRMANLPYENVFGHNRSSKCKIVWMLYNDEKLPDSHFGIERLNKLCHVDLNSHLTREERASAMVYHVLAEEHLNWPISLWRFKHGLDNPESKKFLAGVFPKFTGFMVRFLGKGFCKAAMAQGVGYHSKEEIIGIGENSLRALSIYLGDKAFIQGDTPCEHDCAIFGMMAQVCWQLPGSPYEKLIKGECGNLSAYCERMKERFWPDWDECITHGGTKTASK